MQRRYIVTGKVQRVGFRYAAYRQATALGLSGYVRNLPDGQVETCVGGSREALEKFLLWLHKGPVSARVDRVMESGCDDTFGYGFTIR